MKVIKIEQALSLTIPIAIHADGAALMAVYEPYDVRAFLQSKVKISKTIDGHLDLVSLWRSSENDTDTRRK